MAANATTTTMGTGRARLVEELSARVAAKAGDLPLEDVVMEKIAVRVNDLAFDVLTDVRSRVTDPEMRWAVLRQALALEERATI